MGKIFFIFTFFVLLLDAKMVDAVAVVVKGSPITLFDIKKEMRTMRLDAKRATDILIRKKLEEAEIRDKKITVSNGEIYDDIKKTAARNNMSVSEFYEAVRNSSGLNSSELKEKIREKILSQKLYASIAYRSVSEPSEEEIEAYYEANKDSFAHPSAFDVIIYQSRNKSVLEKKVKNPMFFAPTIASNRQTLPYDRISPELASLLERTPVGRFSPIVPDGKGGFMTFYMKEMHSAKETGLKSVKSQIISILMAQKRENVLKDYFQRLRQNADIKILRTVDE